MKTPTGTSWQSPHQQEPSALNPTAPLYTPRPKDPKPETQNPKDAPRNPKDVEVHGHEEEVEEEGGGGREEGEEKMNHSRMTSRQCRLFIGIRNEL